MRFLVYTDSQILGVLSKKKNVNLPNSIEIKHNHPNNKHWNIQMLFSDMIFRREAILQLTLSIRPSVRISVDMFIVRMFVRLYNL